MEMGGLSMNTETRSDLKLEATKRTVSVYTRMTQLGTHGVCAILCTLTLY